MKKLCKGAKVLQFALALFLAVTLVFAFGNSAKAATAKPAGLKQTDASTSGITVTWDTVLGSKCYMYSRISNNPQMQGCSDEWLGSNSTSCSIHGLNAGRTWYVQIGTCSDYHSYAEAPADTVWSDVLEVVTAPEEVENSTIKYDSATETSITISWGAIEGATSYNVLFYTDNENDGMTVTTGTNSVTASELKKNTEYNVKIYSKRSNSNGSYIAEGESYEYGYRSGLPTLPTVVTGVDCDYFDTSVKTGSARFSWDKNEVANGYEYEIYKYDGKKALTKGFIDKYSYNSASVKNSKLKSRQVYKIRVRAYVNTSNNDKVYGKWSSYDYFCRMAGTDVSLKKSGSNKIKTSWKKVTGATGYTIYLGTTSGYSSSNVKYKKIGTTKKTSYDIKTKLKKNKYYYVRVIPNYKKGKTTYSGTVNSTGSYSAYAWYSKYGNWYYYN